MSVEGTLTKRIGPLPLWGWVVAGGGAVFVVFFLGSRKKAPVDTLPYSPSSQVPGGNAGGGSGGVGGVGGTGSNSLDTMLNQILDTLTTNHESDSSFQDEWDKKITDLTTLVTTGQSTASQDFADVLAGITQGNKDTQAQITAANAGISAQITDLTGILGQQFKDVYAGIIEGNKEQADFFGASSNQSAKETDRIVAAILGGQDIWNLGNVGGTSNPPPPVGAAT